MTIADQALDLIRDGMTIGLGTGQAATDFVKALGQRVRAGLRVRGVPTSEATRDLAYELGIPLTKLNAEDQLDITFDGADEVDPNLDLIKGYGGALIREKIVAASSKRLVILVGEGKEVAVLGARGKLPVEVVEFGMPLASRRLTALGLEPQIRIKPGSTDPVRTDNGNVIFDCHTGPILNPEALEQAIHAIPSVVGTGLFLGMAESVFIQAADGTVRVRHRS